MTQLDNRRVREATCLKVIRLVDNRAIVMTSFRESRTWTSRKQNQGTDRYDDGFLITKSQVASVE